MVVGFVGRTVIFQRDNFLFPQMEFTFKLQKGQEVFHRGSEGLVFDGLVKEVRITALTSRRIDRFK